MLQINWSPHYEVGRIESMAALRAYFPDSSDYTLNWLVLSTSGVHGTYGTLDDVEACLEDRCEKAGNPDHEHDDYITVLVIQPRLVVLRYGHIQITREDIPWLREVVSKSLAGIRHSQEGNVNQPYR